MTDEPKEIKSVTMYVNGKSIGKMSGLTADVTRSRSTDSDKPTIFSMGSELTIHSEDVKLYTEAVRVTANGVDTGLLLYATKDNEISDMAIEKLNARLREMKKEGLID